MRYQNTSDGDGDGNGVVAKAATPERRMAGGWFHCSRLSLK